MAEASTATTIDFPLPKVAKVSDNARWVNMAEASTATTIPARRAHRV